MFSFRRALRLNNTFCLRVFYAGNVPHCSNFCSSALQPIPRESFTINRKREGIYGFTHTYVDGLEQILIDVDCIA